MLNGSKRINSLWMLGVAGPLVAGLAMTWTFAAQETAEDPAATEPPAAEQSATDTGPAGLSGILPPEPPEGLYFEDFSIIGGNWSDWSEKTAGIVGDFYMTEGKSLAEQRATLAELRKRLETMEGALADERYKSLWDPLTTIHGRLVRRVDLAEAMLDTLELTPEKVRRTRLEGAGARVAQAVRGVEQMLQSIRGGSAWRPFVKADEITALMKNPADAEAALPVLISVRMSLTDLEGRGAAQQKFLSSAEFTALADAIGVYVDRAREEQPPLDEAQLREQLSQLVTAIENFEADGQLAAVKNAESALAAIAGLSPDKGARIESVIATYYQNNNFQIVASEELLSRYVKETRRESDPIGEYIQGSYVSGSQNSLATTAVDLRKHDRGGLFDLTLNGAVRSSTVAQASQANARIWSSGSHRFVARRSVLFNGEEFRLGPHGVISVNANITTTGASTSYDGGLFAGTARRRAYSAANARQGESERIAENKIRARVLPEFETEVEKEFKQANKDLNEQWNKKLEEAKLTPASRKVYSTDQHLFWSSRIARPGEFSGSATTMPPAPEKGVTLHVHETMLNAMFDRMNIAGRTMTDAEFRKEVEDYFAILFGPSEEAAATEPQADPDQYVFAAVDPIRFQIENDTVNLVIRTGIRQEGKDEIPTQKITVPLTFRLEKDVVVIERGSVKVAPVERPESRSEQIVRSRIMATKIEEDLGNRTRPRTLNVSRGEGKSDLVLNVSQISALNGWVTIWAE